MNKKFLSAVLFGALMVSSTGTFVSCKDYDDDIDNLQTQVTANADAIKKLQELMGQGQYVTGVTKTDAGLVFSMSNGGASITIPVADGKDGKDGTIITMDPTTKNWVIDGKDTGVCAQGIKGDKGDKGETGAAGVNGHSPKIDEATGCWSIWDDAKQAWVVTDQSAIGAQTYVVKYENPEYWELNVMQQDANGKNIGFTSVKLPLSGSLMSITPELNGQSYAQNFKIYYGILTQDVAWKGHKAENGKMTVGMYPTTDRDIKMQLNPSDVDANNYNWSFVSTDASEEIWGLAFGTPQPWSGKATTATRAVTSANGLWSLPRNVVKFTLDSSKGQGREDYALQFKSNDAEKYLFALEGESQLDGQTVKSPYVYTFQASNVNSIKSILPPTLTYAPSGSTFVPRVEYKPNFDTYFSNDNYDEFNQQVPDSVLIYDYYLEIDKSSITDESIKRYGLRITDDGYRFVADKDAVINNTVTYIYHYILINGQTGETKFKVNFNDQAIDVVNKTLASVIGAFDAKTWKDYADAKVEIPNAVKGQIADCDYAYFKDLSLADFFTALGEDGKLKWIDAIARSYGSTTDPKEINKAVFDRKEKADDKVYTVELLGGDPINNQGQTDIQGYNGYLLNEFITFDYVDATGKTCLTGNIRDLDNIASLRVYFGVNSTMGTVAAPYYTTDGKIYEDSKKEKAALPLENAFRIEVATRYDQYEVSKVNFTFELTAPECPITQESAGNKTTKWDGKQLIVYGEMLNADDKTIAGDMRDAFQGAFDFQNTAYPKKNVEADWYTINLGDAMSAFGGQLIGASGIGASANLGQIANSSVYSDWNTIGYFNEVDFAHFDVDNVTYYHFGVYKEVLEDSNFGMRFGSLIEDSQKHEFSGTTPLSAPAVYDASGSVVEHYTISVSDANFNMTDAFGRKYYLFDNGTKSRAELTTQWVANRQGLEINKTAPSLYGLYPVAKMQDTDVTGGLVKFALDSTADKKTTKLVITIDESVGAGKTIDVSFTVTDIFGHSVPVNFQVQTLK